MSVIDKLSSSTGTRSKEVNKALAGQIASQKDRQSIADLIELLDSQDKKIQSDCIEVLYETGYLKPDLIVKYHEKFLEMLESKNNRLVWGAMIALSCISSVAPSLVSKHLSRIAAAVDKGSVITKDAGVAVYAHLSAVPRLLDELKKCPPKQLPQYAEKSLIAIVNENKKEFVELFRSRMPSLEKESQKRRLEKILKKIDQV